MSGYIRRGANLFDQITGLKVGYIDTSGNEQLDSGGGNPVKLVGTTGVGNVVTAVVSAGWVYDSVQWKRDTSGTVVNAPGAGSTTLAYTQVQDDVLANVKIYPDFVNLRYVTSGLVAPANGYYLGQIATNTRLPTSAVSANKQLMARSSHFNRGGVQSALRIAYDNLLIAGASQAETATGYALTISAGIEYPIGSAPVQVLWGGSPTVAVASLTAGAVSDSTTLTTPIPDGARFMVRTYMSSPDGIIFENFTTPAGGYGQVNSQDAPNGEELRVAASGLSDQTLTTGALTGSTGNLAQYRYGPSIILGVTNKVSIIQFGDSIGNGAFDRYAGASGDRGVLSGAIGPNFAYANFCQPAEQIAGFLTGANSAIRRSRKIYFSHAIFQHGRNDIVVASSPPATVASNLTAAIALVGLPAFVTTPCPTTTSSDNWATEANQTLAASKANTDALAALVRAGISGAAGYIEVANTISSAPNSGKWAVTGAAYGVSVDGIHPSNAGRELVRTSGVFNPAAFVR